jgi:two-component system, sensor histidine kinase and response regulator
MPDMDGIEATTLIRQHEKQTGGYTPIVALTAHTMKGDRERCLEVGMDGYIHKPIDAARFLELAEAAASAHSVRR